MRRKIIAANWKMNMTLNESGTYLESFLLEIADEKGVDIVLIPPFTALARVSELLNNVQNVKVGAQNMHFEKSGAYTGEISAGMIRELFAKYVVLGHSERRTLFGETDEIVNRKTKAAIEASLRPIVCIGETLAQRDAGQVEEVLETQLAGSLAGVPANPSGRSAQAAMRHPSRPRRRMRSFARPWPPSRIQPPPKR
jgi:triosephosphate isomerase